MGEPGVTELSVIIPAYHEEENLADILPRIRTVLAGMNVTSEIIVVDTIEPTDNTPAICNACGTMYVSREGSNSYGDAVRTGISKARGKSVIFMDADGSHDPEFIPSLYEQRNGNDVIIASRYVDGGNTDNTFLLRMMSRVLNFTYSLILNLKCRDVSNSFKLYDASQIKSLILKSNNFDIIEEILFKLRYYNRSLKIKEVPFHFKERVHGETKRNLVLFMFSFAFTMIKLRFSVFGDK